MIVVLETEHASVGGVYCVLLAANFYEFLCLLDLVLVIGIKALQSWAELVNPIDLRDSHLDQLIVHAIKHGH